MLHAYRIEHRHTRVGPFQTDDPFTQELAVVACRNPAIPSAYEDGLGLSDIPFRFVFGCPDLDSLRTWFLPYRCVEANRQVLLQLQERGFVLSEYLVDDGDYRLSKSGIQVAFDAAEARREGLAEDHDIFTMLGSAEAVA